MTKENSIAMHVVKLLILSVLLTSCGIFNSGLNEPEIREEATQGSAIENVLMPTAASTEMVSILPSTTETPEAEPTPTITPINLPESVDRGVCIAPNIDTSNTKFDLPGIDTLRWIELKTGSGELRHLEGITAFIWSVEPSPDGQWIVLELLLEDYEMNQGDTALYVIDLNGEGHWIASESGPSDRQRKIWLPDGRLLWLDGGGLFIANGSGGDRRDLQAPENGIEIWLGAMETVLVSGERGMWRVNHDSGDWDRIEGAPRVGNLSVSLDGTYAMAVTFDGESLQYWNLPIANGEPAELLVEALFAGGHGGRLRPPQPIPNSSLWFTSEWIYFEEEEYSDVGIIEAFEGSFTPVRELVDFPSVWTNYYEISPDQRWMFLGGEYFTSGEDLNEGLFVDARVLGWESDPAGVYLLVNHPEGASANQITSRSVEHIALPGGETTVLIEGIDPHLFPEVIAEDVIYALDFENIGAVVYALSIQGEIQASVGLPELDFIPDMTLAGPSTLVIKMPVRLREPDGEYFRVWLHLGKDKAHFQATSIDNAIDIMMRLRK